MTHNLHECGHAPAEIYLAGTVVPAGQYRRVGTNIKVFMEAEGHLPASLDGQVACYESIRHTWHQIQQNRRLRQR